MVLKINEMHSCFINYNVKKHVKTYLFLRFFNRLQLKKQSHNKRLC